MDDKGFVLTGRDLDDYIYRVAGCVGEFWTKICRAHVFPEARLDDHQLLEDGIRFGKGLQLVNILRDIPQDLRNGRCYVPRESLAAAGLTPENLLLPENESRFRPVYDKLLAAAGEHQHRAGNSGPAGGRSREWGAAARSADRVFDPGCDNRKLDRA